MSVDAAVLIAKRPCPNCGAESSGVYCPHCGEIMEPRVLRIRHYLRDIAQEVLSLDTKLLNSIPALLFHPGFLAQEFVAGRRKRYLCGVQELLRGADGDAAARDGIGAVP